MSNLKLKTEHQTLQPLGPRDLKEILERNNLAHLGCSLGGEVYVVPITYAVDGDYLYAHSRQGHKVDIMRRNPRVCFEVEEIEDLFHWQSVIVWGSYEELFDEEAARAMRLLIESLSRNQDLKVPSLEADFAEMSVQAVFFRVRIERMTGRRES